MDEELEFKIKTFENLPNGTVVRWQGEQDDSQVQEYTKIENEWRLTLDTTNSEDLPVGGVMPDYILELYYMTDAILVVGG